MDKPNNPPAFPRTGEGFGNSLYDTPGMTLRDWFAGQFIREAWDIACSAKYEGETAAKSAAVFAVASRIAYEMADAMLAERERRQ